MEGNPWTAAGRPAFAALDALCAINRLYLDLLALTKPSRAAGSRGRLDLIAEGVAQLDGAKRLALPRAPFALFDARFSDGAFWSELTSVAREPVMPAALGHSVPFTASFSQMALFFAWHVSRLEPLAARALLGMAPLTQRLFERLSLPFLQQLALQEPRLIEPRWCARDTVWPIFLGAAHCGPEHLSAVYLLGVQLSAGDLSALDPFPNEPISNGPISNGPISNG